ncbi:MAG: hypothetical protein ACI8P9_005800 [Parasphingorhabdus sp.]|jgi:hypothetical protein
MTYQPQHAADVAAINKVLAVKPSWTAMCRAADAVKLDKHTLLHAGPKFSDVNNITRPILNSAKVTAVFEGIADDFDQAESKIHNGEIQLRPAQDFDVVTPLAAVVSSSMSLHQVEDAAGSGSIAWAPLNGGNGAAPRLGQCHQPALDHLNWMYSIVAPALEHAVAEGVDLLSVAAAAIQQEDDCHGRTPVGTKETLQHIQPSLANLSNGADVIAFIEQGPSFFLNIWMAACKCMLSAARNTENSSLVISAGANGASTGIQLAANPAQWIIADAVTPTGKFDREDLPASRGLGAIGDSAIVDAMGFGAMAMSYSKPQQDGLGAYLPESGLELGNLLLSAEHPAFGSLHLPVGLTARACVESGLAPIVSLGILDREGELGRLGGGIFTQPLAMFTTAVSELQ